MAAAVKAGPEANVEELRAAADESGIALLLVAPHVRWDQLETVVHDVIDGATLAAGVAVGEHNDDLFALGRVS